MTTSTHLSTYVIAARATPAGRVRRFGMATVASALALAMILALTAAASAAGGPGFDRFGSGRLGGQIGGGVTVTAVSGNDLSLTTVDGWTRTITVTSATTVTKAGQAITVGDIAVGDAIRFTQTANADGSYTIDAIGVVTPTVGGTVTQVGAGSFTLTSRGGTVWTITTTGSTTYQLGFGAGAAAGDAGDVVVGSIVLVQGTAATNATMTAVNVRIQQPRVGGTVTEKTADTITIQRRDGTTTTVHVSGTTSYRVAGQESASLADVTVGMRLIAEGAQRSDGSLDASSVVAGSTFRGPGRGSWPGSDAAPSASPATTSEG
ncbi:MAG TPA: DUF5666 domain-containing protein [Candidatus Limnocylindrales bacterium]